MSEATLNINLRKINHLSSLSLSLALFNSTSPLLSLSLSLALPPCPPLSSVSCLSPAPLEGDVYYLVLRPLLDFYFSSVWCSFNAVEMEKRSSYNDNYYYYCFGIMVKTKRNKKNKNKNKQKKTNKRNVLLNVVQIALEMLCFLKRAQT